MYEKIRMCLDFMYIVVMRGRYVRNLDNKKLYTYILEVGQVIDYLVLLL